VELQYKIVFKECYIITTFPLSLQGEKFLKIS